MNAEFDYDLRRPVETLKALRTPAKFSRLNRFLIDDLVALQLAVISDNLPVITARDARSWSEALHGYGMSPPERSGDLAAPASPQRFPRPFRPLPIIVLAATRFSLMSARIWPGVGSVPDRPACPIPQLGAHDGAGALEIDLLHGHDDDRARRLAGDGERRQQGRIGDSGHGC